MARKSVYQQAYLWSLVLQAVHIPHQLSKDEEQWLIHVEQEQHGQAVRQIASFEQENKNWPPPAPQAISLFSPQHYSLALLAMGGLAIFYWITGPWQSANPWFANGAVQTSAILQQGQWWRLVTALTLHADLVHLLGNVLFGGLIIHFLCKNIGSGLGLFLVLLAGLSGNALNILWRSGPHLAVGFSTAVFAAVGMLSGLEMKRNPTVKGALVALGGGLGLLAMLGTEGPRTDLGAHIWGLVCGALCGFTLASLPRIVAWGTRFSSQLLLLALTIALIWLSWLQALAH